MTTHRRFTRLAIAFVLSAGANGGAFAEDDACKRIADAMAKQAVTPYHQYVTATATDKGGKSRESESINTVATHYLKVDGKWSARPYDGKKNAADILERMSSDKPTCSRVGEEVVDGQATTLYRAHNPGMLDNQIWISASTGLPLRQVADTGLSHMVMRNDYTDVQPPANAQ